MSGRLTPAAATLTRISPAPGSGACQAYGLEHLGAARRGDGDGGHLGHVWPSSLVRLLTRVQAFGKLSRPSCRSVTMDIDDARPVKKPDIVIGENLDLLSVAELEQRISILESEIVRIREAIAGKSCRKGRCRRVFRR